MLSLPKMGRWTPPSSDTGLIYHHPLVTLGLRASQKTGPIFIPYLSCKGDFCIWETRPMLLKSTKKSRKTFSRLFCIFFSMIHEVGTLDRCGLYTRKQLSNREWLSTYILFFRYSNKMSTKICLTVHEKRALWEIVTESAYEGTTTTCENKRKLVVCTLVSIFPPANNSKYMQGLERNTVKVRG